MAVDSTLLLWYEVRLFFFCFSISSLELSDTKVYESYIRALLGTASHFCEAVVLRTRRSSQPPSERRRYFPQGATAYTILYHMNIYICIYIYMYMYIYICICIYIYVNVYLYMYIYLYRYIYMYIYLHMLTYIILYTNAHNLSSFRPASARTKPKPIWTTSNQTILIASNQMNQITSNQTISIASRRTLNPNTLLYRALKSFLQIWSNGSNSRWQHVGSREFCWLESSSVTPPNLHHKRPWSQSRQAIRLLTKWSYSTLWVESIRIQ